MRKPYQSPGRMKNSSYYIAPVGDWTHDLPHSVASNMVKVSHALNHSATEAVVSTSLSPLTLLSELQRCYMMTINLSIMGRTFMTLYVVGILDSVHRAGVASPCCPSGTFSLPDEWRSYVTSSQGMECRKVIAFSVAKCLSHSCCVKIPECRDSASTKCEPETVTTILLRHTNAYDYNYVSTVLGRILFIPRSSPSEACTNILVSASSCVQLISLARSQRAVDNTS